MGSVSFNHIASGLVAPIFAFEVNSGGAYEAERRILLIGHKTAAGSMAANTPVYAASQQAVDAAAGQTSILRDMYRRARANAPSEEIWIAAAPATGTAQTWTLTVGTVPDDGGTAVLDIAGEEIALTVTAGTTAATLASDLADAINDFYDELTGAALPVTATVAASVVTVTAAHAGAIFTDLDFWIDTTSIDDNLFDGVLTIASATAGTGTPDLSTLLATLGDDEWTTIVSPWSDSTNLGRYRSLMSDTSGRWSWMRQSYGHVWTVATDAAADLMTLGDGLADDRHISILGRIEAAGDATPAWAWVAAFAALQAVWLHDGASGNVSRNMSGLAPELVTTPRDRSKWPGWETRNAFLKSRLSTWTVIAGAHIISTLNSIKFSHLCIK